MTDISVMTEINGETDVLSPAVEMFVLRWGDLGGQWGVNRSVAQIHALLYLSEVPLTAEDIAARLGMARSNVSNSVKELLGWKLIERVPVLGDRRDHYAAETDLWEMVRRIAAGRKEREIDPVAAALADCLEAARADPAVGATTLARIETMQDFVVRSSRWYEQMLALPVSRITALMNMGDRIVGLLGGTRRGAREKGGDVDVESDGNGHGHGKEADDPSNGVRERSVGTSKAGRKGVGEASSGRQGRR